MEANEAREHLQWVDGILRVADRNLHLAPSTLIAWGLFGAIVNGVHQARAAGLTFPADRYFHLPLMLVALAATVWGGARRSGARQTLLDSQVGTVFSVVFGVVLIVNLTAQHSVVPAQGMAVFWAAGLSIAMLIVGLQASRVLLVGGLALLAANVAACSVLGWFDGLQALGWTLGLVVPGVVLALEESHGRAAAV